MSRFLQRKSTAVYEIEDDDIFTENPLGLVDHGDERPIELKPLPEDGKFLSYASAPIVAPSKIETVPILDDLPEGWTWTKDAKNRVYYVNIQTGASQWARPGSEDVEKRTKETQLKLEQLEHEKRLNEQQQLKQQQVKKPVNSWQEEAISSAQQQTNDNGRQTISGSIYQMSGRETISRQTITARARPKAFGLLTQKATSDATHQPTSITNPDSIYNNPSSNAITEGNEEDDDAPPPPPPGNPMNNPMNQNIHNSTTTSSNQQHQHRPSLQPSQQAFAQPGKPIPGPPPSPPISPMSSPSSPSSQPQHIQPLSLNNTQLYNSNSSNSNSTTQQQSQPQPQQQQQQQLYTSPNSITSPGSEPKKSKFGALFKSKDSSSSTTTPSLSGSFQNPTNPALNTASGAAPIPVQLQSTKPLSLAELQSQRRGGAIASPTMQPMSSPQQSTSMTLQPLSPSPPPSQQQQISPPPPQQQQISPPPQSTTLQPPTMFFGGDDTGDDDDEPPPPPPPPPPE